MKHLKKFNENNNSEMSLEYYFVDFTDEGFTIERNLNEFKLKYTGVYDFTKAFDMYNDVITKLQEYGKSITKTDFSYRKSVINILIEVKNVIKTGNEIEITLRGEKIKLIPHAYELYGNYFDANKYISCIILFCKDEENNNYNITWDNRDSGALNKVGIRAKVKNTNINIDLENTTKVVETIKKNEIKSRFGPDILTNTMLTIFNKVITPDLLTI